MADVTFVDASGLHVHYQFDGPAGAPVLALVHSLGTSTKLWTPQIEAFSRSFRVLRCDVRGHGNTDATPAPYTIDGLARDFLALLDVLGIKSVDYCGVSLGGFMGQWLGAHAPQRIRRMVLANTAPQIGPPQNWTGRIATIREHGMSAIVDASIDRWFTPEFQARVPDVMESFRQTLRDTPAEGYIGCCCAIRDMDLRGLAAQITAPTLVVAGSMDRVTSVEPAAWLAGQIPSARALVLPSAHLTNVEAADDFNHAVGAFLSET